MRIYFAIAMIMAALASTAHTRADEKTVPFSINAAGYIVVPLEISGEEASCFILDTAARRFGITNEMADLPGAERVYRGMINHVSSGGNLRLPHARLHNLRFAGHELELGNSAIFPSRVANGPVSCGVLGFDAYHGYVMRLNGPARRLELDPHSGDLARAGWRLISAEPNNQGALMIQTSYRGQELTVILATGLSRSMLDYSAAELLFPERFEGKPKPSLKGHGATIASLGFLASEREYKTLLLPDFAIKSWHVGNVEAAVTRLPARVQTGHVKAPLLMLGADVLAHKDFALDTRSHQLWVPPAAGMQPDAGE